MSVLHSPQHQQVGTGTLMFTDIEGSTLLWEQYGNEVMADVLAAHNAILRQANAEWEGQEINNEGDGFCFVFSTAQAAVRCALDSQLAFNAYPWSPLANTLRIRIGIHTGDLLLLDDEYQGMPANLAKRITDAGHGGQILLSAATHELVKAQFPRGSFLDLGEHHLKNIQYPEQIFQLPAPHTDILTFLNALGIDECRWFDSQASGLQTAPTGKTKIPPEVVTPALRGRATPLQTEFPPLKTVDNLPNNLPTPMNSFIGRASEVRDIVQHLIDGQTRLVTLTGAGGIGKTRLALQVATEVLDTYPDGVWFVPLADLVQPEHVITEIATALAIPMKTEISAEDSDEIRNRKGVPSRVGDGTYLTEERDKKTERDVLRQVVQYLSGKKLLLVLDNFEHVMAAGMHINTLLRSCPTLHCLVTSRELLQISGEQTFRVPPLSVPSADAACEALCHFESVQLFLARAKEGSPNFTLTDENAGAVGAICRAVDGLSLAIELAAARVRGMTPHHILERLSKQFALLSTQNRDVPARHQTLSAVMTWSYQLLEAVEQRLLCQLTHFSGGFFLEAVETICSTEGANPRFAGDIATFGENCNAPVRDSERSPTLLDLIFSLHDKSLLITEEHQGRIRYRLSVPLQRYMREKQPASPEFRKAHAHYYLLLAQEQAQKLKGAEQSTALSEMAIELDNFRAAFGWAQEAAAWSLFGQLAVALSQFFYIRGLWSEGVTWLQQAETGLKPTRIKDAGSEKLGNKIDLPTQGKSQKNFVIQLRGQRQAEAEQGVDTENLLASLQVALAKFYNALQDCETARQLCEEGLQIFRTTGHQPGIVKALNLLGIIARYQDAHEEAEAHFREGLQLAKVLDDKWLIAYALDNLGLTAYHHRRFEAAKQLYTSSLHLARELGDKRGIAYSLNNLGKTANRQGLRDEAIHYHTESLEIRRELADKRGIATSLNHLGLIAYRQAAYAEASRYHTESLHIQRELGDKQGISYSLSHLGLIAYQQHNDAEAKRYYTKSLQIARELSAATTSIAYLLDSLGKIALRHGEYAEARRYYTESLRHRNEGGQPREIADSLYQFGRLFRAEGKLNLSLRLFLSVARIYAETGATSPLYARAVGDAIEELQAELDSETVERLKLEDGTQTLEEIVNTCFNAL